MVKKTDLLKVALKEVEFYIFKGYWKNERLSKNKFGFEKAFF